MSVPFRQTSRIAPTLFNFTSSNPHGHWGVVYVPSIFRFLTNWRFTHGRYNLFFLLLTISPECIHADPWFGSIDLRTHVVVSEKVIIQVGWDPWNQLSFFYMKLCCYGQMSFMQKSQPVHSLMMRVSPSSLLCSLHAVLCLSLLWQALSTPVKHKHLRHQFSNFLDVLC